MKTFLIISMMFAGPAFAADPPAALLQPEKATAKAPAVFKARFKTTKGDFVVTAHREWAPLGADRFYNLVKIGYFSDIAFFRAIDGFMVQFGIAGSPAVSEKWREQNIADDPAKQHNTRGFLSFAMAGPGTRTTQMFINLADNSRLDSMGFAPFGEVSSGMEVIDQLYKGYGEGAPGGRGPSQEKAQMQGNTYLRAEFPQLDYIKSAKIEK